MIGIYIIKSPSGRCYIGKSTDIKQRWADHKKPSRKVNNFLNYSFKKYGIENHLFQMLHELPEDIDSGILNEYEKLYILMYKECGIPTLNLTEGGTGGPTRTGMKNSEKQRMAASKIGKLRKLKPEQSRIMLEARLLKYPKKEKVAIGAAKTGSKEFREKMSNLKKSVFLNNPALKKELLDRCLAMCKNNIGKTGAKSKKSVNVVQLNKSGDLIKIHHGMREAARNMAVDRKTLSIACKDSSRSAGGFKWSYEKDYLINEKNKTIQHD